MTSFPFLSVLTLLPLVGAGVVAVLPQGRPQLAKTVALADSSFFRSRATLTSTRGELTRS